MAELPDQASGTPPLADVVATLRHFADGCGALQVAVAIDQGEGFSPVLVSHHVADGSVEVSEGGESRLIPDAGTMPAGKPVVELHLHSFPRFEVDPDQCTVAGPIGALDHLANAVIELAVGFGGRSVASATFATDIDEPLQVGAGTDGEVGLSCGDIEFETPPGWPRG